MRSDDERTRGVVGAAPFDLGAWRACAGGNIVEVVHYQTLVVVARVFESVDLPMATNKSKKSGEPPASISICIVPLRLNVLRLRMMRAR